MREKIIIKSVDLFLTLGFKSVTMDDIAHHLGCSKKTIYQHFENKTKLVEATTNYVFNIISKGIDHICSLEKNPIDEIYDIKHFVMDHLKDEKSSPQYQLQKYYPKIFESLKTKQFEVMYGCVKENLRRGIEQNIYRSDINIEFITRIYFNCILAIKDNDLFPLTYFSMNDLMEDYLDYHLHGICTPEGLKYLKELNQTAHKQLKY